jgi:hypothetical protein
MRVEYRWFYDLRRIAIASAAIPNNGRRDNAEERIRRENDGFMALPSPGNGVPFACGYGGIYLAF